MSLDVYLEMPVADSTIVERDRIFIRRQGRTEEISREEWDALYPGREPAVVRAQERDDGRCEVFQANITHNLGKMAAECGLYEPLWHPEDLGITRAGDLVDPIKQGLALLRSDPERFKKFNPANGWGDYDGLVSFASEYLGACERWPDAEVKTWR